MELSLAASNSYKRMQKQEYNKKRISPSVVAIIGAILTLTGGFFISYNYIQSKKVVAYDYMANIFYESNKEIGNELVGHANSVDDHFHTEKNKLR